MQLEIFYLQLESNNQTTITGGDLESLPYVLRHCLETVQTICYKILIFLIYFFIYIFILF
jgi:hypothetical protein